MGIPELHRQKFDRLAPEQQRNLGGLGPVELLSRLLYVEHLDKVAAAMDAPTARAYSALATRVLSAAPRAEVERRVADLRKTASALAHDASMRTGAWGVIGELKAASPAVPEEFVTAARQRIADEAARARRIARVPAPRGAAPGGPVRSKALGRGNAAPSDMLYKRGTGGR